MTVKQLIEELSKYPDNMDVYMAERQTEFKYGLLNSAYIKNISFTEDPEESDVDENGDELPKTYADVVILDEE